MTLQPQENRIRDALRSSHQFALYFAAVAFGGAVIPVLLGRVPVYALVAAPALGYAIYFLLPLILQLTGAATSELNVNLWFAWAFSGGLAFFMVGIIATGHKLFATGGEILRTGLLCASAWIVGVILVWGVWRMWLKRGA